MNHRDCDIEGVANQRGYSYLGDDTDNICAQLFKCVLIFLIFKENFRYSFIRSEIIENK